MKRFLVILSMFSIILSLSACLSNDKIEFDIANTKDIVLGNEVDSVLLTTADGETVAYDYTANFYEIFDKIGFEYERGKKYSHVAETKLGNQSKTLINMNTYWIDHTEFYEFRAKKDGDNAVALIEEYCYQKNLCIL